MLGISQFETFFVLADLIGKHMRSGSFNFYIAAPHYLAVPLSLFFVCPSRSYCPNLILSLPHPSRTIISLIIGISCHFLCLYPLTITEGSITLQWLCFFSLASICNLFYTLFQGYTLGIATLYNSGLVIVYLSSMPIFKILVVALRWIIRSTSLNREIFGLESEIWGIWLFALFLTILWLWAWTEVSQAECYKNAIAEIAREEEERLQRGQINEFMRIFGKIRKEAVLLFVSCTLFFHICPGVILSLNVTPN